MNLASLPNQKEAASEAGLAPKLLLKNSTKRPPVNANVAGGERHPRRYLDDFGPLIVL